MRDSEITKLLTTDSRAGLRAAVEQYSGYVRTIVYSKLGGSASAEDIEETVSDIFLMFYKAAEKRGFELRSAQALLSVIAKRRSTDVYRSLSGRAETIPIEELSNQLPDEEQTPDPRREQLLAAVKSLGKTDEEIFVRKYYLGQKSADIARDMGMRCNTVDKRISRGLKKLRDMLREENE